MSREIKFRAWHIKGEGLKPEVFYSYDKEEEDEESKDQIAAFFYTLKFGEELLPDGQCEIMQFTGLRDKNGKEIYEGDILKDDRVAGYQWTVSWDNRGGWRLTSNRDGLERSAPFIGNSFSDLEVIGNLYENPELLEAQS